MTDVQPPVLTPPKVAVPKSGRGLRIALAVSVAVNLAIAGVAVGAFLRNHSNGGRDDTVRELGFGPFTEALLPQDRLALRRAFFAKAPDVRNIKRERRADAMAVLDALRAPVFSPEALSALMAAQQHRTTQQLALGQQVLRDFMIAMPAQDRAAFAGRLEQRLHPRGGDREKRRDDDAPQP